jgi:hypothetical protein
MTHANGYSLTGRTRLMLTCGISAPTPIPGTFARQVTSNDPIETAKMVYAQSIALQLGSSDWKLKLADTEPALIVEIAVAVRVGAS